MRFNKSKLNSAMIGLLFGVSQSMVASAQVAVPVSDPIVNASINGQGQLIKNEINMQGGKIATQIINSQEVTSRLADKQTETQVAAVSQAFVEHERRLNAERFSAHMGAKVKPACANTMLAKVFKNGADLEARVGLASNRRFTDHVERNKNLSNAESTSTANVSTFLNKIVALRNKSDRKDQAIRAAAQQSTNPIAPVLFDSENSLSMTPDETGMSDYIAHVDRLKYLIDPFPAKLQPDFDDPNQSPSTREESAKALWKIEMRKDLGRIINNVSKSKGETYSADFVRYLFPEGQAGEAMMKSVLQGMDSNTISKSAALQIMNRYRAMTEDWQIYNSSHSGSLDSKAGDLNLMVSQMLLNQDVQNNLLSSLVEIQVLMTGIMLSEHVPDTGGK